MNQGRHLFLRALLAFLVLPGVVAVLVPLLLARPWAPAGASARLDPLGLVPLLPGLTLLLWCTYAFYAAGRGTLAPWDPPRHLVTSGVYARSRNPMYVAVTLILLGWTVGYRSWGLALYAALVVGAFHLRIVFGEEPWLANRHGDAWRRYEAQVPRWIFPTRHAVYGAWIVAVVALPIAGLLYEGYADGIAARDFPAPGTLVDVGGGRRLHLLCLGQARPGEPTVMFEGSGFGVTSLASAEVRERLASRTRSCSYDRMGMGWSDPGPGVVTVTALARDLAVLEDRAGIQWPLVLVASSVGGLTAEMFARQYPERVAGLVLLDPATSDTLPAIQDGLGLSRFAVPLVAFGARFGLIRLLDPLQIPRDTEAGRRSSAFTYGAPAIRTASAIVRGLPESRRELEQAPPLPPTVPLVVLSAARPDGLVPPGFASVGAALDSIRFETHQSLAARSTRGSWHIVSDSDHLIATSQPDAVVEAVIEVLREVRGQ